MHQLYDLDHRKVLSIAGNDRYDFLQGLITKDIHAIKNGLIIYALFLSPKGRIDFDLFLFEKDKKIFIDTDQQDELFKRLSLFKLRSQVDIKKESIRVCASFSDLSECDCVKNNKAYAYRDPRHEGMGGRLYSSVLLEHGVIEKEQYDAKRLSLNIPDGIRDMPKGKALPMEWQMDKLNAIDFDKGCYIGQELTTRSKFGMVNIRKIARFLNKDDLSKLDEKRVMSQYNDGGFAMVEIN